MKGFKKVLFVLIALGIVFALVACSAADKSGGGSNSYDAAPNNNGSSGPQVVEAATGRKRVYTVNCRIETGDFNGALDGIAAELTVADGYMDSSEINNPETGKNANFALMVKTEKLNQFLEGLKSFGKIVSQKTTSKDVTPKSGGGAGSGDGYDPYDYSTVNIVLYEKGAAPAGPTYGDKLVSAFSGALGVFKFILIAVIYVLPFAIIGVGIFFLVYGLKKRDKRLHPEKYAAKAKAVQQRNPSGYGQYTAPAPLFTNCEKKE